MDNRQICIIFHVEIFQFSALSLHFRNFHSAFRCYLIFRLNSLYYFNYIALLLNLIKIRNSLFSYQFNEVFRYLKRDEPQNDSPDNNNESCSPVSSARVL